VIIGGSDLGGEGGGGDTQEDNRAKSPTLNKEKFDQIAGKYKKGAQGGVVSKYLSGKEIGEHGKKKEMFSNVPLGRGRSSTKARRNRSPSIVVVTNADVHASDTPSGSAGLLQTGQGSNSRRTSGHRQRYRADDVPDPTGGGGGAAGGDATPLAPLTPAKKKSVSTFEPDLFDENKKYFFVERVDLSVNNFKFASLVMDNTRHDASAQFMQFKKANGSFRSGFSEGITYSSYNASTYIVGWDLSTSEVENANDAINSTASSSQIRVEVTFSDQSTHDIMMLTHCIYSGVLGIDKDNRVFTSFANSIN
jgi:hypothetical protein